MNNKKQQTNQSENTLTEIFKYEVKEGVFRVSCNDSLYPAGRHL